MGAGQKNYTVTATSSLYNFGVVFPGANLTHEFILHNNWEEDIVFQEITTTCGCTVGALDKSVLMPGESTKLVAHLKVRDEEGFFHQKIQVKALLGKLPMTLTFTLDATAKNVITFSDETHYFNLGTIKQEDLPFRKRIVVSRGSHPMKWDVVRCISSNPNIKAVMVPLAKNEWALSLEMVGQDWLGSVSSDITFTFFKSNELQDYALSAKAGAQIVGPVYASPGTLYIGVVSLRNSVSKTIKLFNRSSDGYRSFEIIGVCSSIPQVMKVEAIRSGSERSISAQFQAGEREGLQTGEIVVSVKTDKSLDIHIPFLAMVVSKKSDETSAQSKNKNLPCPDKPCTAE